MLPENSFRFEQLQLQLVEDVNGILWISAVADFNGQCFTHCHHVSLSREKKIGTLFIRDLNEKKTIILMQLSKKCKDYKKSMKLIPPFKVLSEPLNHFIVYNIRSFNKHYS